LQDPRVVVLDEATLSLDAVTEEAVTALLRQWQGKKTVIIVAHQQQGSWPLTRLLRLDGGRIVEDQLGKSCEEARSE
jgi:ABC-type bacteriocin/lantibiotic exporter with double-glycine peptidase domain